MIIRKTWRKLYCKHSHIFRYIYTGYFLFGIIPLYVRREEV